MNIPFAKFLSILTGFLFKSRASCNRTGASPVTYRGGDGARSPGSGVLATPKWEFLM